MNIQSPENEQKESNFSGGLKKRQKKMEFRLNFNLKPQEILITTTKADSIEESTKEEDLFPMFDESDILFLQKPSKQEIAPQKRPVTSVDISKERSQKMLNSKTLGPQKRKLRTRAKKRLKLNIKKGNSINEIPTVDREMKEIDCDAEK